MNVNDVYAYSLDNETFVNMVLSRKLKITSVDMLMRYLSPVAREISVEIKYHLNYFDDFRYATAHKLIDYLELFGMAIPKEVSKYANKRINEYYQSNYRNLVYQIDIDPSVLWYVFMGDKPMITLKESLR